MIEKMKTKAIAGMITTLFLASMLPTVFIAASEQTTDNLIDSFLQPGKFYTLVGREINWEIIEGEKTTSHFDIMLKWSIRDVVGNVAIVNRSTGWVALSPEGMVGTVDADYAIDKDRTILWGYRRRMIFTSAGFDRLDEWSLNMDVGEHTWAWFPTDLNIGAEVPIGWTWDDAFVDDVTYKVVSEEVIQIVGEKQDSWVLHMSPSVALDGLVWTDTYWVDKDTGVPLKLYTEIWAPDGSRGTYDEIMLVQTNIDLGQESTRAPAPAYTLTFSTSPGFPEAGKFYTWHYIDEGWYMSGATKVAYYGEGLWTWFVTEVSDDVAVVNRIVWSEYVCEAEGVEQLEDVRIRYYSYRVSKTTRAILDLTVSTYRINMTSLSWSGGGTTSLTEDIGEKTYGWLPTNLHIGANVDVTWTFDDTLDNATYTVTGEKIVSAIGETQASWALYLPPTTTMDEKNKVTETLYSDRDVGIPLEYTSKSEAVDGLSASVSTMQLMDTNINLGPGVKLSIKLTGGLDYLYMERVKIRLTAVVNDPNTIEPVSGADVTLDIYNANGNLWMSTEMTERLQGTGIYEWESSDTIKALRLEKGVYLALAHASFPSGPTASDTIEFHIDPPADSGTLTTLIMYGAVLLVVVAALLIQRKIMNHRLCPRSQQSNMHTG